MPNVKVKKRQIRQKSLVSPIEVVEATGAMAKPKTKRTSKASPKSQDIVLTVIESSAAEAGLYKRNHLDWLEREDTVILDRVMAPNSMVTVFGLAAKFGRDPILVALHILEGDLPDMCGLEANIGSEEEAEFLGLVMGGAPVSLALRWCSATLEQDDRPLFCEIESSLTRGDMRPAMNHVRELGLWLTSLSQLTFAQLLLDFDLKDQMAAISVLTDRAHALSPEMVFQQMCGSLEDEKAIDWARVGRLAAAAQKTSASSWPGAKKRVTRGCKTTRTVRKSAAKDPWSVDPVFTYKKSSTRSRKSSWSKKKKYSKSAGKIY